MKITKRVSDKAQHWQTPIPTKHIVGMSVSTFKSEAIELYRKMELRVVHTPIKRQSGKELRYPEGSQVEQLLLHFKSNYLVCFGHLIRVTPRQLLLEAL